MGKLALAVLFWWSVAGVTSAPVENLAHPRCQALPATIAASFVARDEDCICGTKTKCGQMESCAEARCFLEKCGVTRLDGDSDGVPCEAICG